MLIGTQRRRAARGTDAVERFGPVGTGTGDPLQTGFKYVERLVTDRTVEATHNDERPAGAASDGCTALLRGRIAVSASS